MRRDNAGCDRGVTVAEAGPGGKRAPRRRGGAGRGPALAAALSTALAAGPAAAEDFRFLSVGSGELDGGYHSVAGAICEAVNRLRRGRLRCSPEVTPGSRYNVEALVGGELDFALAQSDVVEHAWTGTATYAGAPPQTGLRRVARLYLETVTILARPGAGIRTQRDLIGKRIDIGPPASGRNATTRALLDALGTAPGAFAQVFERPAGLSVEALCAGTIDAAILIVGHPSALVADAAERCGAEIAAVTGPRLRDLADRAPFFLRGAVPARYAGMRAAVPTIGVAAFLMTRADMAAAVVEAVTAAMLQSRPALAAATPLLAGLTPEGMARGAGAAPLHPGAEAAFAAQRP